MSCLLSPCCDGREPTEHPGERTSYLFIMSNSHPATYHSAGAVDGVVAHL
jgi:hypothetical protein